MSDGMRDALILSGILIVIVLATQAGRHRLGVIKLLAPLGMVGYVAYLVIGDLTFTTPNLVTAAIGTTIGLAIGVGLMLTMSVERDPANKKLYTRAGLPYVAIWLIVLVLRLTFIWAVENVTSFAKEVGEFLQDNSIDVEAVTAFFVLMAMTMVLVRTLAVAIRGARLRGTGAEVSKDRGDLVENTSGRAG
ncbi:DUF1453 domain-containing protein [Amycolatopsis sp. NPDC051071]|uniref:DUF1453 domain-containing protein n=1 Tax=Amycolatopsis sp. NPDC051071 TaxID=3154637 RepID=UPI0034366DD0